MIDRKRYSKQREAELWRVVDKALTDFRLAVLRGHLHGLTANAQEDRVFKALGGLADKIATVYRAKLRP